MTHSGDVVGDTCCRQQAGKKRRRPTSTSLITVAYCCQQILCMNSIGVVGGSAITSIGRRCTKRPHIARGSPVMGRCVYDCSASTTSSAFVNPGRMTLLPTSRRLEYTSRRTRCVHPSIIRGTHLPTSLVNRHRATTCIASNIPIETFVQRDGESIQINEGNWKTFTDTLNETLDVQSISVPAHHVHWLLSDKQSPLRPYLATQMNELEGVHPKIKAVRDCEVRRPTMEDKNEDSSKKLQRRKRVLLNSHLASVTDINIENNSLEDASDDESISTLTRQLPGIPEQIVHQLVNDYDALPSVPESIHIPYHKQPISRILSKILPRDDTDIQSPPSSYEQIGHVAHLNLRKPHLPYARVIGRVMLDKLQPSIRTVVNKLGEVGGPYRTYQMDLLAGEDDYNVHVVEHSVSLHFDLRNVYWCTRLEGERTYMIKNEFQPNQLVADAFCGVGALCIRAALTKGCRVVANDLNPDAVKYCRDSARKNGIDASNFHVECGDASQFIMNLGIDVSSKPDGEDEDEEQQVCGGAKSSHLPDHLILNFPLDSPSFLNSLRWWPSSGAETNASTSPTRVHVYTFSRGDEERTAADVAIDMVADGLLPEGGYVRKSKFRAGYLNELGCDVQAREIRDAAPGKLVICVSFSVTRLLLRRMQGDYGLD